MALVVARRCLPDRTGGLLMRKLIARLVFEYARNRNALRVIAHITTCAFFALITGVVIFGYGVGSFVGLIIGLGLWSQVWVIVSGWLLYNSNWKRVAVWFFGVTKALDDLWCTVVYSWPEEETQ